MSDFGFDPSIILAAQQVASPGPQETMMSLADLAQKRQQQQVQQVQLGQMLYQQQRQRTLADLVRQGAGNYPDPIARLYASGGFGQEAEEAQTKAFERQQMGANLLKMHADLTRSRLSSATTPEQVDAVTANMPDDVRAMYGAPKSDAAGPDKLAWAKGFVASGIPVSEPQHEFKETVSGDAYDFNKFNGTATPLAGSPQTQITPGAVDIWAKQLHLGGAPDFGRDPGGMLHRAALKRQAELYPNDNVEANKAELKANAESYEKQLAQADQIKGYIRTFDKNVDGLESAAAALKSSNSPLLNKGLRYYQTTTSGDPNLKTFQVMLNAVASEAGKINSGSTGQGGVPISVLEEMEQTLPKDATPQQIIGALRGYRQDSQNRLKSMQETVNDTRDRLRGKKPATAGSGPDHGAAAVWLRNAANKSNPNYARALAAYKSAHGGSGP